MDKEELLELLKQTPQYEQKRLALNKKQPTALPPEIGRFANLVFLDGHVDSCKAEEQWYGGNTRAAYPQMQYTLPDPPPDWPYSWPE